TGNEGVSTVRQQFDNSSTTVRQMFRHIEATSEDIEMAKTELGEVFNTFTKQEFLIFFALYQLEEELKRPINYREIAVRIKLSGSTVRDHIKNLIDKKAPILKRRVDNKQVFLSITPEFRRLETLENLIKFRESLTNSL
ncbi:MAG: winged helix-turn-helix domain-containing protein, partial [Nanoarchaeota archaeon]